MKTTTAAPRKTTPARADKLNRLRDILLSPLYGAACGDALGTTLEFSTPNPRAWDSTDAYHHIDIVGAGPFRVTPGQITDDTMMACAAANAYTEHGRFDPKAVATNYVAWRKVTFDIGGTTSGACSTHESGLRSGREYNPLTAVRTSEGNAANGGLMRATPHAVFAFRSRRKVLRHAMWDAMLSHTSPLCCLSNAAYCVAIAKLLVLRERGMTTRAFLLTEASKAAKWAAKEGAQMLLDRAEYSVSAISDALSQVMTDLAYGEADDPCLYGEAGDRVCITGSSQGYVRVAFRMAWWEAFHAPSYKYGVIDCVNRGGDADTTGAIVGGLLGALFGIGGTRGIPSKWVSRVHDAKTRQGGLLDTTFHPVVFDAFVDSILANPNRQR